jgi:hypothetical protein
LVVVVVVASGTVVVVVAPFTVVVVVAGTVVVVVVVAAAAFNMASSVTEVGGVGVTPVGSKAIVRRMYSENLMVVELVVMVGVFWAMDDQ